MITIFEHDITESELKSLFIYQRTREEYLANNSTYTILADLSALFKLRGDMNKFVSYLKSAVSFFDNKTLHPH